MNIKSIRNEADYDAVLLRNAANGRIVSNSDTHPAATRHPSKEGRCRGPVIFRLSAVADRKGSP